MTRSGLFGVSLMALTTFGAACHTAMGEPGPHILPAPVPAEPAPATHHASAVFAGGCFWGVQSVFEHVRGVTATRAGFDGGARDTADYETVSSGDTGHAESVEVDFDPTQVSYGTLMRIFFSVALDPTQVNRQFPDDGTQYRSVLYTRSTEQAREAHAYIAQLDAAHVFARPIATQVTPDHGFYPAEADHQNFAARYPDHPYIATYDAPRIEALHALFASSWRPQPVLTLADDGGS
ncbi:peptide-methionine (S)-S-oxide reductase MsrA [Gluconacetobacter sp. 1c LMG 22058]|uniref:Peptide methionine sulfoxide reductase MsrA n=1 Tax=Gluconacetobacter dulcium TaxID=2729096 RepID=A0A7W4K2G1_9PROT|nr:peptide-methionine (S)-S-oxide reductase MsrA [Gluconacetobacter dulcium]MBB2199083.1 peptide-methionine (S)-S-oxide reductase MsrA [Gluconacetobacter dulcium]